MLILAPCLDSQGCDAWFDKFGYDGYAGCEYNARSTTIEALDWAARYRIRSEPA